MQRQLSEEDYKLFFQETRVDSHIHTVTYNHLQLLFQRTGCLSGLPEHQACALDTDTRAGKILAHKIVFKISIQSRVNCQHICLLE